MTIQHARACTRHDPKRLTYSATANLRSGHEGRNQRHQQKHRAACAHGGRVPEHVDHVWGITLAFHDFGPVITYHRTTSIKPWSI